MGLCTVCRLHPLLDMKFGGHFDFVNLAVFQLRHRLFGPGRFQFLLLDAAASRQPISSRTVIASIHGADRARVAPRCGPCRHGYASPFVNQPRPWPYDTGFPTVLSQVELFPGQLLSDMPSSGAQRAKPARSDNKLSIQPASTKPWTADHLGKHIDVFA